MAEAGSSTADVHSESKTHTSEANGQTCTHCANHEDHQHNHDDASGADGIAAAAAAEATFQITVRLPHEPYQTTTIASTQEQAQDIRQSIIDAPHTYQYSCFHLECNGQRIPDFVDLGEIPGVTADAELTLVEDPYTEKDARIHVLRIRGLIGAAGDKTSLVYGVQAGLSLHEQVFKSHGSTSSVVNGNGHAGASENGNGSRSHAMAGFELDAPGSFSCMLPVPGQEAAPRTVKAMSLSPWNPPPYNLRSRGHLLYLQVTTNEGDQHQITAHVSGFFVNKSSNSKFDPFPRPAPKNCSAHSLLSLISKLSPSFDASFRALQEYNGQKDQLAVFQPSNAIPASPWLVDASATQLNAHLSDLSRSQESFLISGVDNAETLRDWNEEFQTTRELPRETVQDRVFRERVTSKLYADYNDAATQGAVLIARGEVAPLNPTENRDAQIFVYNNVFYSFGADGVGTFTNEGGDEAARAATGKDVVGVKSVSQLDIPGLSVPGTVIVDYLGKRLVGQSIVPGIFKQREPGEQQIDYGGVEGKDVVAENEAFVPLFKKLSGAMRVKSHPVWDKEGKRHSLEASVETKGLLGTDGRKYVLDLYRITPLDVSWIENYWIEPSPQSAANDNESATSAKHDDKKNDSYPHRMTVLRPELVETFWRLKLREYVKDEMAKRPQAAKEAENGDQKTITNGVNDEPSSQSINVNETVDENQGKSGNEETTEQERVDISGFDFALNPDVFSGQQPQSAEEKEEWTKDEANVRAVCDYLHGEVLPRLIVDLNENEVGFPMDGQSLTALLHKRGINVRYLGKIAELSSKEEPRAQALKALCVQEMIARAFKHVANRHINRLAFPLAPSCAAHLLNCLLGSEYSAKPKPIIDEDLKELYSSSDFEFERLTPSKLQAEVARQVYLRYRFTLESEWEKNVRPVQLLREVALKLGFQFGSRQYQFKKAHPQSNGTAAMDSSDELQVPRANEHNGNSNKSSGSRKKKSKPDASPNRGAAGAGSAAITAPLPVQTFYPDDIVNIVPVIKEAAPKSVLAEEALEAGRISVIQNQRELGQELLLESLSLHEQIYGILHPEVARVYYQLSTLFYGLDDKNIAVELARKAVIVSERTLGVDSSDTILSYLNLGLFEHASGNTRLALVYIRHALELWKIVYGAKHQDSITTLNNAAVMLQHLKLYHDSREWFETSLTFCKEVYGPKSVNTATLLFQLAQALALDQDSKAAVNHMRQAYNIFNTELGASDRNTKEAETWLEQLTQNAVSIAKHAKDVEARRVKRINQLTPGMSLVGGAASASSSANAAASAARSQVAASVPGGRGGIDNRNVDELLRYIEGASASSSSSGQGKGKKQGGPQTPVHPRRRAQKA